MRLSMSWALAGSPTLKINASVSVKKQYVGFNFFIQMITSFTR